ncbi:MAG: hypothetical protein JWM47_1737 [Acidimicrobiales bacterium]|nr:hypothetical protein [Acidimicrobiales bacterium]
MNVVGVALYVVFAAVAFGWRTWLQWRRTGDSGLRVHAAFGSVQWWAKLGFVAALFAGFAAPLAGLAGLDPLDALDHSAIQLAGVGLAVVGIAATVAAQWQMGASWRIGVDPEERTGLVTHGVFAAIRNPIFTAMVIFGAGMCLAVGNAVGVAGLAALVAALEVQVRSVEEPYLKAVHGAAYVDYGMRAGRFLPTLGRFAVPDE